jgi:hypothetical protein
MSMSIADMYQEMIDQHTELYMYRKTHKGKGSHVSTHEDILDDMSAVEVDMEYTNET